MRDENDYFKVLVLRLVLSFGVSLQSFGAFNEVLFEGNCLCIFFNPCLFSSQIM